MNLIEAGRRCFILATGPSIKKQDLRQLAGETCIAVSNFFVHQDFQIIRPKYYCLAPHHPPISEKAWADWMNRIDQAVPDTTRFFLPLCDRERDLSIGAFGNKTINWIDYSGSWENLPSQRFDLAAPVPLGQSVSVMALIIAIGLGFNEIILLGCDHDWILHIGQAQHFYPEERHTFSDHGYNEWINNGIGMQFRTNSELWRQYGIIRNLASSIKLEIKNATAGGLLDVFPRMDLASIRTCAQ